MTLENLLAFLELTNELLNTAIVVMALSLLLYNLSRNFNDRVNRAAGVVLGCITGAYIADSALSLNPEVFSLEAWYRFQWIGILFIPAGMFHLADALLATTGQVSRWRRRLVQRSLYALSSVLVLMLLLTDWLVDDLRDQESIQYLTAGWLFPVFVAYFVVASVVSLRLVQRARKRCLTASTRRRMTYLLGVFIFPGLGIFPYSTLFDSVTSDQTQLPNLLLYIAFNIANLLVVFVLLFMAYPLSFFGTSKPDRLVKADLLQFLLRGPLTAIILLSVMIFVPGISSILGLPGESFAIFAAVGLVLFSQWSITLLLPRLERRFIDNDFSEESSHIRSLSERLLTRADTAQMEEAILAAARNQLRSEAAFLATLQARGTTIERMDGEINEPQAQQAILQTLTPLSATGNPYDVLLQEERAILGQEYWLFLLRQSSPPNPPIGLMGMRLPEGNGGLSDQQQKMIEVLTDRATRVMADSILQAQILDMLSELLHDIGTVRNQMSDSRFGYIEAQSHHLTEQRAVSLVDAPDFTEWVHDALRNFWGGPRLGHNELTELSIIKKEMDEQQGNAVKAVQTTLNRAIESLKPDGERNMTSAEWRLYNILDLRFVKGKKVRDVARQLAMSEPDFYRKQKIAIEEVAARLREMEHQALNGGNPSLT